MNNIKTEAAVFNVCFGAAISINALIELLRKISQKSFSVHHGAERAGDIADALGDPKKAQTAGIRSQVQLEKGLQELWESVS